VQKELKRTAGSAVETMRMCLPGAAECPKVLDNFFSGGVCLMECAKVVEEGRAAV
jgi:hypothetical protein